MTTPSHPSRPAGRLILSLAGLATLVGGILFWVARRGAGDEGGEAGGARAAGEVRRRPATKQGAEPSRGGPGAEDRVEPPPRVDRRRLAEHLRWLRRSAEGAEGRRAAVAVPGRPGRNGERRARHGDAGSSPGGAGEDDDGGEDVQWPISRGGIRGAIRARIQEVKECYEGWLTEDPELGGQLVVSFAIEPAEDGATRIREANIQGSELQHSGLERCILVMVESLQFEPPEAGRVVVRYPFRFSPSQAPRPRP